jgi:ubiquinone/menaquinone biosynthesis C-methylase UbiE
MTDPDDQRAEMAERWQRAAAGWGRRAARVREWGMPVSAWMIDHLELQPGQRVLELAAGPGDTGFLAAELVAPSGSVISSDSSPAMLDVARARASELGIANVEFEQLELEWIDLPTASVDAVLCRWGVMLIVDPAAALREMRRVLRPRGRAAVAVWAGPDENPWATIPTRALVELGHAEPPDPNAPGMFALAADGRLTTLLEEAGFVEVVVESVALERVSAGLDEYMSETLDLSAPFAEAYERLDAAGQAAVEQKIAELAKPYAGADSGLRMPGRSLVAAAGA